MCAELEFNTSTKQVQIITYSPDAENKTNGTASPCHIYRHRRKSMENVDRAHLNTVQSVLVAQHRIEREYRINDIMPNGSGKLVRKHAAYSLNSAHSPSSVSHHWRIFRAQRVVLFKRTGMHTLPLAATMATASYTERARARHNDELFFEYACTKAYGIYFEQCAILFSLLPVHGHFYLCDSLCFRFCIYIHMYVYGAMCVL